MPLTTASHSIDVNKFVRLKLRFDSVRFEIISLDNYYVFYAFYFMFISIQTFHGRLKSESILVEYIFLQIRFVLLNQLDLEVKPKQIFEGK